MEKRDILKCISIQGFKTFPDKISLNIEEGVTAIVGPNGSGKSNISDAIKWVLGEQNPRALRCEKKMEEIIFHGTQKRGPVGFSEVALRLDNAEKIFPHGAEELVITRRLYRSGESEYYINKTQARLKDINELLMDTGLGSDGYSVIGQGMVKKIISDKSAERRKIFEEASGIAKFRYRKEDSERKLKQAEDNLLRIGDKIDELEPQVISLKLQAEKARNYLLLRDELRGAEINIYMDSLDKIRQGFSKLKEDYMIAAKQSEAGVAALDELYTESERLEYEAAEQNVQAERVREALQESRLNDLESEQAVLVSEISHSANNVKRILEEMEAQKLRLSDLNCKMEAVSNNLRRLYNLLKDDKGEISNLEGKIALIAAGGEELEAKIEELRAREYEEVSMSAKEKAEMSALEMRLEELSQRYELLSGQESERLYTLKEAEAAMAICRNRRRETDLLIGEHTKAVSGCQNKRQDCQKYVDDTRFVFRKAEIELNTLSTRFNVLNEQEKEYQGFSSAVKLVMKEKPQGVFGTVAELIKTEAQYAIAIEIALGGALQNIVVETEENAKAAIELLKGRNAGRATFLPLSSVNGREIESNEPGIISIASRLVETEEKYKGVVRSLLGKTCVVENMDKAIAIAKRTGYRFRIVTLDGQLLNAGGSITGGSIGVKTGLLSRKNELETLKAKQLELKKICVGLKTELTQGELSLGQAETDLAAAREKEQTAREVLAQLIGEYEHKSELVRDYTKAIETLKQEIKMAKESIEQGRYKLHEKRRNISKRQTEAIRIKEERENLAKGRNELKEEERQLYEQLSTNKEKKADIQNQIASDERALSEMERIKSELLSEAEQKSEALMEFQRRKAELERQHEIKRGILAEIRNKMEEHKGKLQEIYSKQRQYEAMRTQKSRQIKEQSELNARMGQECTRMESKLAAAEAEEKAIVDKLWDQYELTPTACAVLRTPMESISKTNRQIAELRKKISALGTPNIGAVEAYKEVSERYEMLTSQRADAVSAKNDLEKIIERITEEMKRIFTEEIRSINEKFAYIFSEIFGGGQAYLEFDEPEDILGSGIEIKAQPPGKKLKSISLLSGGETSLTAIALYFALFKVRPAPFCFLDEIDHDLDDANVERFAEYLKRLAEVTQFVVITHRRGTMEAADVLYGVTSQDAGISKVIPLKLSQVSNIM